MCSVFEVKILTTSSSLSESDRLETLRFLMMDKISLMNATSSSLFFIIENLNELMFSLMIGMDTVRGV